MASTCNSTSWHTHLHAATVDEGFAKREGALVPLPCVRAAARAQAALACVQRTAQARMATLSHFLLTLSLFMDGFILYKHARKNKHAWRRPCACKATFVSLHSPACVQRVTWSSMHACWCSVDQTAMLVCNRSAYMPCTNEYHHAFRFGAIHSDVSFTQALSRQESFMSFCCCMHA